MDARFAFEETAGCICGAALDGVAAVVKELPQGRVAFAHCRACGGYMQSPRLTAASLTAWYESPAYRGGGGARGAGYADYARDERQRRVDAASRYRRDLAGHLPPGAAVFEIGCASGALLAELRAQGHVARGCDLSQPFADMARTEYGLEVAVADWLAVDITPASLDAVVMLGTVSNLRDLHACLAAVRARLKPGGFLFFNFPAADGVLARVYGSAFWMFTPSIMQVISRVGIVRALERAGLRVEDMRTDRQAPSLGKLLGHARLGALYPLAHRLGLLDVTLPVALPLPGILAARARPA